MAGIIPFEIKNYLEDLKSKETYAFEDAPVFNKFLELLCGPAEELQEVFRQLIQDRSIDTAYGVQLDIIGDIVGQPRELLNADLIPYFGFVGYPEAKGYGSVNNPSIGGFYWDITQPLAGNILLNDEQYRIFIRAKILKNITRATPEDVISFIKFVFDVNKVQITLDGGAEALIMVSDDISQFELVLLRHFTEKNGFRSYFIPKTLGVGYLFGTFENERFFSFLGVPGGKGYGNLIAGELTYDGSAIHDGSIDYSGGFGGLEPGVGGRYASIIEL